MENMGIFPDGKNPTSQGRLFIGRPLWGDDLAEAHQQRQFGLWKMAEISPDPQDYTINSGWNNNNNK